MSRKDFGRDMSDDPGFVGPRPRGCETVLGDERNDPRATGTGFSSFVQIYNITWTHRDVEIWPIAVSYSIDKHSELIPQN
jgi:hypothetical protein